MGHKPNFHQPWATSKQPPSFVLRRHISLVGLYFLLLLHRRLRLRLASSSLSPPWLPLLHGNRHRHNTFEVTTTVSVLRLRRHSIGDRDLVSTSFRILNSLQVSTNSLLQYLEEATN
ncbi:hypothetical protein L1887_03572 [Cichorium endivia]|nr:hypothetical protein L1887_03572 [Cichorium endivia]